MAKNCLDGFVGNSQPIEVSCKAPPESVPSMPEDPGRV